METIQGDLYDFPSYYDVVYGSDWQAEVRFLLGCFEKHAERKVKRVFEPACGTGRLLFRLAKQGYRAAGLDLNPRMADYCNRRLKRHGFAASCRIGDMSDFRLSRPVDAAVNTINSFRHLPTERQAQSHLESMADAVAPGGLYVLGLHLTPTAAEPTGAESWSARRGHLAVITRLWIKERNLRRRQERCGMTYDVYTPTRAFRLEGETSFRTYTAPQFRRLLAHVPAWRTAAVYDFGYDLERLIAVNSTTEDAVFVLQRT
ncbi:MAG: class I SAM-dependent methyltransferase [Planctomycetes bacterium]|nr:class I SAM-dependent methyltransferase [Planctomycetota bacterium]